MKVQAESGYSGKTSVQVVVSTGTETKTVKVPVVVLPEVAKDPVSIASGLDSSYISWNASSNAIGYTVKVDGQAVCFTTSTSCSAPVLVGPKSNVEVIARGNDGLQAVNNAAFKAPAEPIPALTVNFKTASSVLSTAAKAELKDIAAAIIKTGFTTVQVSGHTDSRGGTDNTKLSAARAQAVVKYLQTLLPDVNVKAKVTAAAATQPVASNATADGQAANRRAEISLLP